MHLRPLGHLSSASLGSGAGGRARGNRVSQLRHGCSGCEAQKEPETPAEPKPIHGDTPGFAAFGDSVSPSFFFGWVSRPKTPTPTPTAPTAKPTVEISAIVLALSRAE